MWAVSFYKFVLYKQAQITRHRKTNPKVFFPSFLQKQHNHDRVVVKCLFMMTRIECIFRKSQFPCSSVILTILKRKYYGIKQIFHGMVPCVWLSSRGFLLWMNSISCAYPVQTFNVQHWTRWGIIVLRHFISISHTILARKDVEMYIDKGWKWKHGKRKYYY